MRIFDKRVKTYKFDATRTFDFKRFADKAGDFWLIEGFLDFRGLLDIKGDKIVHLEFEEPNRFFTDNRDFRHEIYEDLLYKVFTICPYSVEWLNDKYKNDKRTFSFIPFNENKIPRTFDKKYDIIYAGHIFTQYTSEIEKSVKEIAKFNYRLVAPADYPLTTDPNADYDLKIKLISESKITLVHNLLFLRNEEIKNVRGTRGWKKNKAYAGIPRWSLKTMFKRHTAMVPQIKSRTFDAAFCKSLILCRKDEFNIIERFFTPGKEFIYYEPDKLEETIRHVLADYDSYKPIIENAYQRAVKEYTTQVFFDRFLKNIK